MSLENYSDGTIHRIISNILPLPLKRIDSPHYSNNTHHRQWSRLVLSALATKSDGRGVINVTL